MLYHMLLALTGVQLVLLCLNILLLCSQVDGILPGREKER